MFRRLHEAPGMLRLSVNGREVLAAPGDTVAAALLIGGNPAFRRTMRSGAMRGPYCGMGVCFDCLITINGQPNRQACLVPAEEGMVIITASEGDRRPGDSAA
jgi:D-hydroxyproline dehydrogenase subunit gamma